MSVDYTTVTETWGLPASPEQLAMQYHRYRVAAELCKGRDVLEVGCGSGMGLPYLAQHARRVIGGDYTMALLREARAQLPHMDLVRMDAEHLPIADRALDVVLMLEMIYYVRDQTAAFAECRRVLRAGGSLMVCVPNPDRPDFNPSPFSTRYPDASSLTRLFEDHGFEVKIFGAFPVEAESSRDRLLAPVRHFAVRYRLIPNSMRAKALVKRVLYGPLPKLGAVHDGMATVEEMVHLDPMDGKPTTFKNLYAVGTLR
ncbi:MAG TPA: class I SAM-dependent methyltransferase [Candidatus Dormibacteraeota bacterium]|jgi:SAM-dependent methyltransferase|nr:class I SAM-dependent methyltransferase [Candidatus Dormibacteraeota bacterium]